MAGAVVLDPDRLVSGVADSKLLAGLDERERLFDEIVGCAIAWSVTRVEPAEIDRLNIHRASLQAMREAVLALDAGARVRPRRRVQDSRVRPFRSAR